jgi:hypothetical protein
MIMNENCQVISWHESHANTTLKIAKAAHRTSRWIRKVALKRSVNLRHEDLSQLIIVLVINLPERVLLRLVVGPEPLKSVWSVVVGVLTLPLIKVQGWLWESSKWVLGLWCLSNWLLIFLLDLLGLWLWCGLWSSWGSSWLWCLCWWSVLDRLVDEGEWVNDCGVDWLVVDG